MFIEAWRCADLPRRRAWHLVAQTDEHLPATAGLFLTDLVGAGTDGLTLVREPSSG